MWEERLHSKKVNHTVTDILQGQRSVHQNLRHKQLWYTGFLVNVFLTHTRGFCQGTGGTLGDHLANTISTSGTECSFWFAEARRDGEARQRLNPAGLGHTSAFGCPSQSRGTLLCCESGMCCDWGKDSGINWKAHSGKGCSRLRGTQTYQCPDLCSHSSNEPHTALVSKNFSLAHSRLQMYKQQGRSYFLKLVVFLQKTKHHTTSMLPSAPLGFRRAMRPSHHCKALHALLFPLPPKGIRKPNQNVKTRKLTTGGALSEVTVSLSRLFLAWRCSALKKALSWNCVTLGMEWAAKQHCPTPWFVGNREMWTFGLPIFW